MLVIFLAIILIGGVGLFLFLDSRTTPTADTTVSNARKSIVGTWQDTADIKDTTTYVSDGTFTTAYDNEIISRGTWTISTSKRDSGSFTLLTQKDTDSELLFEIDSVGTSTLELTYLARGLIHTFTRIR